MASTCAARNGVSSPSTLFLPRSRRHRRRRRRRLTRGCTLRDKRLTPVWMGTGMERARLNPRREAYRILSSIRLCISLITISFLVVNRAERVGTVSTACRPRQQLQCH